MDVLLSVSIQKSRFFNEDTSPILVNIVFLQSLVYF